MMGIYANGDIIIDGKDTKLTVRQEQYGTVVVTRERHYDDRGASIMPVPEVVHQMPHKRYTLSHDQGTTHGRRHVPGRLQFEQDIRVLLASLSQAQ